MAQASMVICFVIIKLSVLAGASLTAIVLNATTYAGGQRFRKGEGLVVIGGGGVVVGGAVGGSVLIVIPHN